MGVFKGHKILYEMCLAIFSYKNKDKIYSKVATSGGYSKSAAFTVCKKLFKARTVKNLLWVGGPERFTKIFEHHATFLVVESLMWAHYHAFISS